MREHVAFSALVILVLFGTASAQDQGWRYSGSVYILTTPEGADLPATASEKDFPLLVRLHKDYFDFRIPATGSAVTAAWPDTPRGHG